MQELEQIDWSGSQKRTVGGLKGEKLRRARISRSLRLKYRKEKLEPDVQSGDLSQREFENLLQKVLAASISKRINKILIAIERDVKKCLKVRKLPQFEYVRMTLQEAIFNAAAHGNESDPSRIVHIEWKILAPAELVTVIENEPVKPFDPSTVPDPTLPENLELQIGRGLVYMRNFMSAVFNSTGNKVLLRRNLKE